MPVQSKFVVAPSDGNHAQLGGLGARLMTAGESVSFVEHPIAPRTLAAPLHVHEREDEYSYVLEGEVGVQIGDEILYATAGDLVLKPRGVWHAFWNRSDEPARLLEIISPGAFGDYFAEVAPFLPPNVPEPDVESAAAVMAKYGLQMDFTSVDWIPEREGLPRPTVL